MITLILEKGWFALVPLIIGAILISVAFIAWTLWREKHGRQDEPQNRQEREIP